MLEIKRRSAAPKLPRFLRKHGLFLLFLATMGLLGFLAQVQWVGYLVIAAYAIIALKKQLPAQTTFILALAALGVVPVAIVISNWLVAQNFAAYSFTLFILGVVILIIELQREPRTK